MRLFSLLLVLGICFFPASSFSQSAQSSSFALGATAGPEGAGLLAQSSFGKVNISFSTGVGGEYDIASGLVDYTLAIRKPRPFAWLSPRWFYGGGSNLSGIPQGHFFGMKLKWTAGEKGRADKYRHSAFLNLHWGHQQALGQHWLFSGFAGPGYAFDLKDRYGSFYPAFDIRVVYLFGSR